MSRAEPQAAKRQERTRRGAPCTTAIELCTRRRRSRLVLNLDRSLNLNLSDRAAIKIKIKSKSKIKKVVGNVNSTSCTLPETRQRKGEGSQRKGGSQRRSFASHGFDVRRHRQPRSKAPSANKPNTLGSGTVTATTFPRSSSCRC